MFFFFLYVCLYILTFSIFTILIIITHLSRACMCSLCFAPFSVFPSRSSHSLFRKSSLTHAATEGMNISHDGRLKTNIGFMYFAVARPTVQNFFICLILNRATRDIYPLVRHAWDFLEAHSEWKTRLPPKAGRLTDLSDLPNLRHFVEG